MEDVNIAAELYISSKQYDKALAVWKLNAFVYCIHQLYASQDA